MDDSKSHIPNMPSAGNSPFLGNTKPQSTSIPSSAEPLPVSSIPSYPEIPVPEPSIAPPVPESQSTTQVASSYTDPSQGTQFVAPTISPVEEPQPQPQPLPEPVNKVRKSRVLVFVGIFVILVGALTAGYYFFFMRTPITESTSDISPEPTQTVEPIREPISYPSINLIGAITSLLANETYQITAVNNTATSSGCSYNETIQVANVLDDYSVTFSTSFANDLNKEACEFEDIVVEYLDLYSITGELSLRNSLAGEFEPVGVDEVPEKMLPQYIINSAIPYPTLLTVTDAYRDDSGEDKIEAEFITSDMNGVYTFTVSEDGHIRQIVYEIKADSDTYVNRGEMNIKYEANPIVLPTTAS